MAVKLVIYGAGAQARMVLEALEGNANVHVEGFMADDAPIGTMIRGYPILGRFHDEPPDYADYVHFAVGGNMARRDIVLKLSLKRAHALAVIHSSALVASTSMVLPGAFVGPRAVINPGSQVLPHAILNTGAILEHDSVMADFAHLAPGAITGGHVRIGPGAFVGIGAMIRDRVEIGAGALVGMGSVVTKSVPPNKMVYGNPARIIYPDHAPSEH